jgi:hypothetical protein
MKYLFLSLNKLCFELETTTKLTMNKLSNNYQITMITII